MIAISNYEQLQNESLDGYYNDLALEAFDQVIKDFLIVNMQRIVDKKLS